MLKFKLIRGLYFIFLDVFPKLLPLIISCMGLLAGYDFNELSQQYPNWPGLFNFISSVKFLFCIVLLSGIQFLLMILKSFFDNKIYKIYEQTTNAYEKIQLITSNTKNLFDGFLINISKKLEFTEGDPTRLSLYIHDGNKQFVRCGRYSPNPKFNKPGRPAYPDNIGCIGEGWHNGWIFANNNTRHGMTQKQCKTLTMNSKLYVVMRIDTADSRPVALLVLESMKKNRFTEENIKELLYPFKDEIATLVVNLKDYIPTPIYASERGL